MYIYIYIYIYNLREFGLPQPPSVLLLGAHGPEVDSKTVRREMVTAGPNCYIHTTNNEHPDPGKHSCTLRFVLVSRHRTLSMLHLNFSKCPLENKSPVHTGQHFSTPNFHVSMPTLENERPSQTVQHFSIPHLLKLSISFIIFRPVFHGEKSQVSDFTTV